MERNMLTWTAKTNEYAELTEDRSAEVTSDSVLVGSVTLTGGSWVCRCLGEVIASETDCQKAITLVTHHYRDNQANDQAKV